MRGGVESDSATSACVLLNPPELALLVCNTVIVESSYKPDLTRVIHAVGAASTGDHDKLAPSVFNVKQPVVVQIVGGNRYRLAHP